MGKVDFVIGYKCEFKTLINKIKIIISFLKYSI